MIISEVKHTYLELTLGIRYYMFVEDNYKLFGQTAFSNNAFLSSEENITFNYEGDGIDASFLQNQERSNNSFNFGFGCQYKNKLALALNYYPVKNLTGEIVQLDMKGSFSLDASYTIF